MNQLEKWFRDGVIKLWSTQELWNETRQRRYPFFEKATQYPAVFARSCFEADNEVLRAKIRGVVFPNGTKTKNDVVDVEAIFVAKMTGAIFVTNDGNSKTQPKGILGSRDRLHQEVGVEVMRAMEVVEIIKRKISARDKMEAAKAVREARSIADWSGSD